ncbi:CAP domain-containing protein [Agriterribacter sp.]|uniref:CAP domain-containing protein n=1 Tax=Agriterribacter sp. TaxID=2821509 RepID=UPI002B575465|nr:CAP domain-containing protein [Agriterribacter sp.]HRO44486.1 CAP domain-containing protein [Agriterribacter sp.]HRQ16488.1 CAP domain-containing protein [Agriterribacter sp.]
MKRFLLIIIVSFFCVSGFGQGSIVLTDKPFIISHLKDTMVENWLAASSGYASLSKEEKEAVYWVNMVRSRPRDFLNNILYPFLEQFPEVKNSYTRSLIAELSALAPLSLIKPSEKLYQVAANHAKDLGSNKMTISHNSSKGKLFQERMNSFGYFECVSENVYEGKENGLQSVIFLLIDTGVKSLGHRKNILDPGMKSIAVSFYPIKGKINQFFMVQNFSCN